MIHLCTSAGALHHAPPPLHRHPLACWQVGDAKRRRDGNVAHGLPGSDQLRDSFPDLDDSAEV